MVATGTWFLGNFSEVDVPAIAWVSAHAVYLHRGPLVHLLSYPSGRTTSRATQGAIAVGYAVAIITPLWRNEATSILLAGLLVIVSTQNYVRSVGWLRRARRIALIATVVLSLVVTTAGARLLLPPGAAIGPSLLVYEVTLCLIAGGLLAGLLAALGGAPVADLVVEVGEARSGTVRGCPRRSAIRPLRSATGCPTWARTSMLRAAHLLCLSRDRGRSMTVLEDDGQPVAALLHDPAVLDDPEARSGGSLSRSARGRKRQASR